MVSVSAAAAWRLQHPTRQPLMADDQYGKGACRGSERFGEFAFGVQQHWALGDHTGDRPIYDLVVRHTDNSRQHGHNRSD